jgi:hypothetical protein
MENNTSRYIPNQPVQAAESHHDFKRHHLCFCHLVQCDTTAINHVSMQGVPQWQFPDQLAKICTELSKMLKLRFAHTTPARTARTHYTGGNTLNPDTMLNQTLGFDRSARGVTTAQVAPWQSETTQPHTCILLTACESRFGAIHSPNQATDIPQ